ncbi:MAG: hypothetical protein OSA37_03890 [Flavobacteriales bacterium]|nr:hypothetical protein [Flavobacteriales bacterium]
MNLALVLPERTLPEGVSEEVFLLEVKAQLIKDFEWDESLVSQASVGVLQLLEDHIGWGMERDATPVFAAFYRLDLGEALVRQILHAYDRDEASKILAEKALQRAALKVWTRWTFREM